MRIRANKALSVGSILAAGCLWGSMGFFVRTLNRDGLSSMQIVEIRCIVTALLTLCGTVLCCPGRLRIKVRDIWCFIGTGICSVLFFNFCYFRAITVLPISVAAVLLYTAPVFVTILSVWLFKEKLHTRKILAMVLAVAGCVLVSGVWQAFGAVDWSASGLLLGLGAGFGYALYSIFSRFAINRGYHPLTVTVYTFLFASLGGLGLTDWSGIGTAVQNGGFSSVAFWVVYAVLTTVLPYLLYTYGLCRIENSAASVIASIEPVTATVLGLVLFSESPTWQAWIGILLVLTAVFLLSRKGEAR